MFYDLPLDFGAHVGVNGVTEPFGLSPGLPGFGQYGVQMPRNCKETRMSEQITGIAPTHPPAIKRPNPPGKPKAEILHKLLARKRGTTVAQFENQLGWQPHTVRAAISRLRSSGLPIELVRSGKSARFRAVRGEDQ